MKRGGSGCPRNFEKQKSDAVQKRRTVLEAAGLWQSNTKGRQLKLELFWLDSEPHGLEASFRAQQFLRYPRTYPHFMQSDSSLSYSQQPATCPYPDLN